MRIEPHLFGVLPIGGMGEGVVGLAPRPGVVDHHPEQEVLRAELDESFLVHLVAPDPGLGPKKIPPFHTPHHTRRNSRLRWRVRARWREVSYRASPCVTSMLCRAQQEGAPPATLAHESSSEQRTQATEPNLQTVSQEDHKQSSGIRLSLHGYQSQQQQFHCCLTSDETTSDSVLAASPSLQ
ncbi:hypothetical protein U1Q18_041271 [Sarracenia purpurea var. burkii]